jgi:hypothetical protein
MPCLGYLKLAKLAAVDNINCCHRTVPDRTRLQGLHRGDDLGRTQCLDGLVFVDARHGDYFCASPSGDLRSGRADSARCAGDQNPFACRQSDTREDILGY